MLLKAKSQDKMIFLSSGYSACHWCHVMAHESFEDPSIARLLNDNFICVKLDREERPDVDAAYMTYVQATSGRGGWPMNVFLTPDGEPLFGGTYFPPPMFTQLIDRLSDLWTTDRERCIASAQSISDQLRDAASAGVSGTGWDDLPSLSLSAKAIRHWLTTFDEIHGGFGSAPKFPSPPNTFHFLHRVISDAGASEMATLREAGIDDKIADRALHASAFTLARIARGGITDHLAGGIARYSVDEEWRVPHFEKMLYDQGQLLTSFVEAVQLCRTSTSSKLQAFVPEFLAAIEGIVNYLERYMTSPDGSIYAAEDADSLASPDADHAKEGAFYVWDATELEEVLGKDSMTYTLFAKHFDIRLDGNIPSEADPHGELVGKNMLHASVPLSETASKLRIPDAQAVELFEDGKRKLLVHRETRPRPLRDDKIVTAWNGLAISGLSHVARLLAIERDTVRVDVGKRALTLATQASRFVWQTMWNADKKQLTRSYRNGVHGAEGVDVDYAFVVQAFLDMYELTYDGAYIDQALKVQDAQDRLFWDERGPGGYLISAAHSDGNVLGRQRGDQEGAEPTSTSVSAHNLLRLQTLLNDLDKRLPSTSLSTRDRIAQCINSGGAVLARAPFALGMRLTALMTAKMGGTKQILIVGERDDKQTSQLLDTIRHRFNPRASTVFIDTTDGLDGAKRLLGESLAQHNDAVRETLADPKLLERGAYATVCQDFVCGLPIHTSEELAKQLAS